MIRTPISWRPPDATSRQNCLGLWRGGPELFQVVWFSRGPSPLVEELRQVPWLAYFIGLSAILALVNVFIPQVTQEGSQFSADKAVAQVQKAEYALLPRLLPPWHWELLPFSLSTDARTL